MARLNGRDAPVRRRLRIAEDAVRNRLGLLVVEALLVADDIGVERRAHRQQVLRRAHLLRRTIGDPSQRVIEVVGGDEVG